MALIPTRSSVYLSFLRPLALPRASTVHRFLSTSTAESSSPPYPTSQNPNVASASTQSTPSTSHTSVPILPYHVKRTPSSNLPIYLLAKRGGNLKLTRLKHIVGNIKTLRIDLRDALKLNDGDVSINELTGNIIIRGWWKPQVTKFLEERKL